MPKVPIKVLCGADFLFEPLWLVVTVGKNGRAHLSLEGENHDFFFQADSPDELRRVLETALKLLDEAVAERNGSEEGQDW
jgi:hypothetical protein